jgi:hypothetical protein
MFMNERDIADLEHDLGAFLDETRHVLRWTWDGYFKGAVAEFLAQDVDVVRVALEPRFGKPWDGASVATAPEEVQETAGKFGGIRPGQFLYAMCPDEDVVAYGAWWPWGSGEKISLRVIPGWAAAEPPEAPDLTVKFRALFGL